MAKTLEDLAVSRAYRESVLAHFGSMPESILLHDKSVRAIDLTLDESGRSYDDFTANHTNIKAFDISASSVRMGALSRFPQNVGRTLLLFYTDEGDTVVDPFAGHNSRMELCFKARRHYVGHDISHVFMQANRKIREMLIEQHLADLFPDFPTKIVLHECDSRNMPCADASGDFTITSPPYWDIEDYGDEKEQIGKGHTYEQFLVNLGDIIKDNYRCLRPGSFCVYCVNDFKKDGRFYSYHEHTAQLLRDAGFIQHDTAIIDLGSAMASAFATQVMQLKFLPKRHEYALIFRKPADNGEARELTPPIFKHDKNQLDLL
jgi:hypothetical protein